MHRGPVDQYLSSLPAAVRIFTPDAPVDPEKRERLWVLLLDNDGVPALSDLTALVGQDRRFGPLLAVTSALYDLHFDDALGGDVGGFVRNLARCSGIDAGASRLLVGSFHQIVGSIDPAWVGMAVKPLALRGLELGMRFPFRNTFRDLLRWDAAVRAAWQRGFAGDPQRTVTSPAAVRG